MKKLATNQSVGHSWYYREYEEAGCSNFYYQGDTIYSYGNHYPIARKLTDSILFTIDGSGFIGTSAYSSTTSRHVSYTRQAIPKSATVLFVNNVKAKTKLEHLKNYDYNMDLIGFIVKEIAKGRDDTWAQDQRVKSLKKLIESMNLYTAMFKLGKRQILPEQFLGADSLTKIKAGEKRRAAAEKKAAKQRQAQLELEKAKKIEEWKRGERHSIPWTISKCYLRIKGDVVETSKGASLSVHHSLLLFYEVNRVLAGGEFKTRHFGSFSLTNIKRNGDVTIGCHTITYEEMERIYRELNP